MEEEEEADSKLLAEEEEEDARRWSKAFKMAGAGEVEAERGDGGDRGEREEEDLDDELGVEMAAEEEVEEAR